MKNKNLSRVATLDDLSKELWLRMRQSGSLYWETRNGERVSIKDMDTNHLINTIKMLVRKEEEQSKFSELEGEFAAYMWERMTS